jgi:hypothetical protein
MYFMAYLGENGIVSIEPIGWLRADNLRCLNLSNYLYKSGGNHITNIKPLAKAYKHSISELNLSTYILIA